MEQTMTTTTTTTLTAPDIQCQGCANSIKKALGTLPGVESVDVNIGDKTVTVRHDEKQASPTAVTAALDKAGFPTS